MQKIYMCKNGSLYRIKKDDDTKTCKKMLKKMENLQFALPRDWKPNTKVLIAELQFSNQKFQVLRKPKNKFFDTNKIIGPLKRKRTKNVYNHVN